MAATKVFSAAIGTRHRLIFDQRRKQNEQFALYLYLSTALTDRTQNTVTAPILLRYLHFLTNAITT